MAAVVTGFEAQVGPKPWQQRSGTVTAYWKVKEVVGWLWRIRLALNE
jgi:hypothetical protein